MNIKISVVILFFVAATSAFGMQTGLPFISDDYARALTQAKRQNLPIFAECWAPW